MLYSFLVMAIRIESCPTRADTRANALCQRLRTDFPVHHIKQIDVYTIDTSLSDSQTSQAAKLLNHRLTHEAFVMANTPPANYSQNIGPFDWALEIGFKPGVTDNIGRTAAELVSDHLNIPNVKIYSSKLYLIQGELTQTQAEALATRLHNPLIEHATLKPHSQFNHDGGMGLNVPEVRLKSDVSASEVDLNVSDEELVAIGKSGIANVDGSRRGPLGLGLPEMQAIQAHFKSQGRNPTDVELETLAQTWSEHCKHTIFASAMDDDVVDGIYKTYIKKATQDIRKAKGENDICLSVFADNAGAIIFDDDWLVCDKVETHNTPSALDPFGGAITGIVGVNRDCMGFGMGAKPILNRYGFCLADPADETVLYRDKNRTQPLLPANFIMDGVIKGIEVGGNCSGIPTPQGFLFFHPRYRGKPLVFCGTVGLMPREKEGRKLYEKQAKPGDLIIMAGGRVGKDGIHGATFSSVALDDGSPVTAVQIGDPITQKKMSDALIKHARDKNLYTSITDNGAGGLSSSIGEMAEQPGGAEVWLDKVPLKYEGLTPWEIWVSESQERMTLAVPEQTADELINLLADHGVEATVIGKFNNSGRLTATYQGDTVMDLTLDFMHDGLPKKHLTTTFMPDFSEASEIPEPRDWTDVLQNVAAHPNMSSRAFLAHLYDHEVQGGSVLKPLQGVGEVSAHATVTRPLLDNPRAVVTSQALFPTYSELDAYHMATASIDAAVRHLVAAGGSLDHAAILDNFCWCSSTEPERLGQLKRAAEGCYDAAVAYGTPFISGKDSMFNDFNGFDANGEPVKISAPPTLLISAIGVMDCATQAVSLDAKMAGDAVYILGLTHEELGGSFWHSFNGASGGMVPLTDPQTNAETYKRVHEAMRQNLIASAIGLDAGGLAIALIKTAIGGNLGMDIDLSLLPADDMLSPTQKLFSESTGRLLVTVAPDNMTAFAQLMRSLPHAKIGTITNDGQFNLKDNGLTLCTQPLTALSKAYHTPIEGSAHAA